MGGLLQGLIGTVAGGIVLAVIAVPFTIGRHRPDKFRALLGNLRQNVRSGWAFVLPFGLGYASGLIGGGEEWWANPFVPMLAAMLVLTVYALILSAWASIFLSGDVDPDPQHDQDGNRHVVSERPTSEIPQARD